MNKAKIKNSINYMVNKAVGSNHAMKYLLDKIGDGLYKCHGFIIEKNGVGDYTCKKDGKIVFDTIGNLQLASLYCYNSTHVKSVKVQRELENLNNRAVKNRQDVLYYRHFLETAEGDKSHIYARIRESNLVYEKLQNEIKSLSSAL